MLPSVLAVRDKWLKKGGMMIPHKAQLFIAFYTSENENDISMEEE